VTIKGAALIYPMLPDAETLIADKGFDSDAFREALAGRGITPCLPPRAKRRLSATYCKTLYRQRHKVENLLARLKDWPRISMRCHRRAHTLFSAICIAATVIYRLGQWVLTLDRRQVSQRQIAKAVSGVILPGREIRIPLIPSHISSTIVSCGGYRQIGSFDFDYRRN
jgi:transposase